MAELRTFRLIPPRSGTGDRISHCESPVTCSQIPADNLQGDDDKLVSADGTNTKRCLIVWTFFLVLKKNNPTKVENLERFYQTSGRSEALV